MEIYNVSDNGVVEKAAKSLRGGGIIVYPTDTAYGLGVDATNDSAVKKLYDLKSRGKGNPMHVVVEDIDMANYYAVVNNQAQLLAEEFLPGPLTLVLKNKDRVSTHIVSQVGTLGIRIPDDDFALGLMKKINFPITATSANKRGDKAPYSIDEVRESFEDRFDTIDIVVDAGELSEVAPSTLVDVSRGEFKIIRKGPITQKQIKSVLG